MQNIGEQIVYDSLFSRKYYTYKGDNKVEYRSYTWDSNIEKYVPFDMFTSAISETWEAFKKRMKNHNFILLDEALKRGPVRK